MKHRWPRVPLGQLLEIQNGYAFDSAAFVPTGGMPLIRIRDLKQGDRTEAQFAGIFDPRYVVRSGDLLIGMDGEFGCYEWRGANALLNQRVCKLHGFVPALMPRFLFYGLNEYLKAIENATGYTTVKHLSSKQIAAISFPLPQLPDQQRIVRILDEAFEGIATAKANAEKNLENARAVFESYLQSVFSKRGEGWITKLIPDIAQHSLGKMLDKQKNKGTDQPYLRNINVRWFNFDLSDVLKMPFLPNETEKYTAKRGDVLICEGGYPGRAAIWSEDDPIHFQKALHRVRFVQPDHAKWFVFFLYAKHRSGELKESFSGTGIQHFTGEALARLTVPIAPLPELVRIVAAFDELKSQSDCLLTLYTRKLTALDALKKSLLHQAFSGAL